MYVAELQTLSEKEKHLLIRVLNKHAKLFQGGPGILNVPPIHLELQEGAQPDHAKQPFTIPQAYYKRTKKEIDCLEKIGVLKKNNSSEWGAATFIQPKKTGDVRVLTDFRKLNAALKRKPFLLPKINDLLQQLAGFTFATAIDLSMAYYHVPLDEESQKLCSTVLPWGKYQYTRLLTYGSQGGT